MTFQDDIPIKGCPIVVKDELRNEDGCWKFVVDHIADYEKLLRGLEDVKPSELEHTGGCASLVGVHVMWLNSHGLKCIERKNADLEQEERKKW
jgi:hypothetical protein